MRALLQRVSRACVMVEGAVAGEIGVGLLILLGISKTDNSADAVFLADKILHLRIFADAAGKMNRSVTETGGDLLIVPQFTLYADSTTGRRPSFARSAPPEQARALYESFVERAGRTGLRVATGVFQAHMNVLLVNDGPVTILVET